ncbi:MAG TPA: hypothetical protein VN615_17025 [Gaiellales bacterium]|nr:hypothetical protein [Gaiellales bacterium]
MQAAGFEPAAGEPGVWVATTVVEGRELEVPIDLIVPEAVAPPGGRRGARLGAPGKHAARRERPIPRAPTRSSGNDRQALMVAKAHKMVVAVANNYVARLMEALG